MAIAAATVWELRTTGTASNVNGIGFNPANTGNGGGPGTDYSQQDSAQYTFTDLASTSASSWLVITSASHTFIGADCGNIIHINSGANFTAGFYEIVSVSSGAATLDRACGSTGNATGGTYHVGGCGVDPTAGPYPTVTVSGNTIYVKSGTYSASGNINWGVLQGTASVVGYLIGYKTTRGDNPTSTDRPLFNFTVNATFLTGSNTTWMNMSFKGPNNVGGQGVAFVNGGSASIYNCKFLNTTTTASIAAFGTASNMNFYGCEFVSYNGFGIQQPAADTVCVINCWFHDSVNGIFNNYIGAPNKLVVVGCIFSGLTDAGITSPATSSLYIGQFINNTFYGGETTKIGKGINWLGTPRLNVFNNIFYGLATGFVSTQYNFDNYNNYFNNTTDVSGGIVKGPNDIALNPGFTNVGQYTGTTATSSGTVMTDSGANFANVVAGRDFLYVSAMTGGSGAGVYGITAKTGTTITTDNSLGTGSAITYSIIYGQNFAVGNNMKAVGNPLIGNPNTPNYIDIGAVQRQEGGGYSRGRIVNAS